MGTVQVRHDAIVRVTVSSEDIVLGCREVEAKLVDAHILVESYKYNANPYSGGGQWWNPSTGGRIKRPKYLLELVDPARDLLEDGKLCDCDECMEGL